MPSMELSYWLLAFVFAQTIFSQAQNQDVTTSGTYIIKECGVGVAGSHAAQLQALLPNIYAKLQEVIADASLGTNSQHGYATFFQTNDNIQHVQGIFRNIANGPPIGLPKSPGRATNPLLNFGWPTIVCIEDGNPSVAGIMDGCKIGINAGIQDNFVALCPVFWDLQPSAASGLGGDCPRVRRNTLTPNDDTLAVNQEGVLVHELAHIYGVKSDLKWQDGDFETYNIGDVADLGEADALVNAANYAYYYSAISADCTKWPNMNLAHDNLRNILEVPASSNSTDLPIIPNPNATVPFDFEIPSSTPLPTGLDPAQGFCNDATSAPNGTVCCDTTSGRWIPAPVQRDAASATSIAPACPTGTGSVAKSGDTGVINVKRFRGSRFH